MNKIERINKLKRECIYNPKDCQICYGTGTERGKRKGAPNSGCAKCAVGNMFGVRVSVSDFKWLCREAAKCTTFP